MKELIVVLDNIRSALNVGAIFRTCDGAGVKKLYLVGITPHPPHPKVLKTALGATESVEHEYVKDVSQVLNNYKENGYDIVSVELTDKSQKYQEYKFKDKTVLIFGHEITGVSTEALELSDAAVELPMVGIKESLNVATTVGILVYHISFGRN